MKGLFCLACFLVYSLVLASSPILELHLDDREKISFVWIPCEGGFWIAESELTHKQISKICGTSVLIGWSHAGAYEADMPVDNLDAMRCQIILDNLNEDPEITAYVPSEAQMEAIHRYNGKIQMWDMDDYGWFSGKAVHGVKQKKQTKSGLYDFYGNVSEICRNSGTGQGDRLSHNNTNWRGGGIGSLQREVCFYKKGDKDERYKGVRLCIEISKLGASGGKHTWSCAGKKPLFNRGWYYAEDEESLYELYVKVACGLNFGKMYVPKLRKGYAGKEYMECLHDEAFSIFKFDISKLPVDSEGARMVLKFYSDLVELTDELIDLKTFFTWTNKDGNYAPIYKYDNNKNNGRNKVVEVYKNAKSVISEAIYDIKFWDMVCADPSLSRVKSGGFYNHLDYGGFNRLLWAKQDVEYWISILKSQYEGSRLSEEKKAELKKRGKTGAISSEDVTEIYKLHKDAFVVISAGNLTGTGFIVREGSSKYLYTNKHVLEKGGKCTLTAIGGNRIKCKTLEFNASKDLARGEVDESSCIINGYFEFSKECPNIGEDIFVIGNSEGLGVQRLLRGKVVGVTPDLSVIEINAPIVEGNSGSAVINASGEVVGIATFRVGERRFAIRPSASDTWKMINWKKYNETLNTGRPNR